jgi:single-strand DNA-binding protein
MNNCNLIGRLTKKPELKKTQSGTSVISFTLAVGEYYNGEEKTNFIECVAWEKKADVMAQYCDKGDRIAVQGRLSVRSYETKTGETRYITEVVVGDVEFLEPKKKADAEPKPEVPQTRKLATEEDLPF